MGQVAGVVVGSCCSCSGGVQAQGQRGHAEGILGRGVGPETTEVLFWYRAGVLQLSGQAGGKRRSRGKTETRSGQLDLLACKRLPIYNKKLICLFVAASYFTRVQ